MRVVLWVGQRNRAWSKCAADGVWLGINAWEQVPGGPPAKPLRLPLQMQQVRAAGVLLARVGDQCMGVGPPAEPLRLQERCAAADAAGARCRCAAGGVGSGISAWEWVPVRACQDLLRSL
jgi:hypothetical protein